MKFIYFLTYLHMFDLVDIFQNVSHSGKALPRINLHKNSYSFQRVKSHLHLILVLHLIESSFLFTLLNFKNREIEWFTSFINHNG